MKTIYLYILVFISSFLSGCNEYFNINEDPNNPTNVDYTTLVPTVQLYGTYALCTSSGLSNELIVYTHQFSTREEANEYGVSGSDYYTGNAWRYMYVTTMQNLELALTAATEAGDNFNIGMLKVLKAYYYSQLVDVFGNVPFSEACKTNEGIQYPKYDKDSEIYPQLFTLLDEGIASLSKEGAKGGSYDLYYGGDASKWIKAANTIKLKLYTQVRLVQDVSEEVQKLLTDGNLISSTEEGLMFRFGSSTAPDERHPGYADSYATTQQTNHISPWFYEILKGHNTTVYGKIIEDPRIPYYFYNQLSAVQESSAKCEYRDGGFVSIYFGSRGNRRDISRDGDLTVPGIYPVAGKYDDGQGGKVNANSGTGAGVYRNLTYADRLYLEAELIQAGVVTGNAKDVLEKAINESFKLVDYVVEQSGTSQDVPVLVGAQSVNNYVNEVIQAFDTSNDNKKMEIIMTQKWIQSFGNAVDQYTDYRRTGYPVMFDPKAYGQMTPPSGGDPSETLPAVPVDCAMDYPKSLPYISDELNLNPNAPKQKTDLGNMNVFWDK